MKHQIEISHAELIDLIKKALNITTPSQQIGLSAHCSNHHDTGYGKLDVTSISLSWDQGSSAWERSGPGDR